METPKNSPPRNLILRADAVEQMGPPDIREAHNLNRENRNLNPILNPDEPPPPPLEFPHMDNNPVNKRRPVCVNRENRKCNGRVRHGGKSKKKTKRHSRKSSKRRHRKSSKRV